VETLIRTARSDHIVDSQRVSALGLPRLSGKPCSGRFVTCARRHRRRRSTFQGRRNRRFHESTKWTCLRSDGIRLRPSVDSRKGILGRDGEPSEFSGGVGSRCACDLKRLGFAVEPSQRLDPASPGILLTWNQERWPWTELRSHIEAVKRARRTYRRRNGKVSMVRRQSEGNSGWKRVSSDQLGQSPKASWVGWTASPVYEDTHFDHRGPPRKKARTSS